MTQNKQHSVHAHKLVIEVQKQIDDNPIAYKDLTELWKAFPGVSRSSIEKSFKPITGYRIKEYLVRVRLEYTKQYLREGWGIKRIALNCFYKSQSAYCTAFRRCFHQSPTDWLKEEQQ